MRLPASVVEALKLHEGDDIEMVIADERVFQVRKKPGNEVFIERLRQFRGSCQPISSLIEMMQMPEFKAFIDTNILLYLLSSNTDKADKAEKIVQAGVE